LNALAAPNFLSKSEVAPALPWLKSTSRSIISADKTKERKFADILLLFVALSLGLYIIYLC